jgi:hypothetical protein
MPMMTLYYVLRTFKSLKKLNIITKIYSFGSEAVF